jgi:hypothetical protein
MKKRKAQRLTGLRISEISSVDRGAGRGARVMLMKSEGGIDMNMQKKLAKSQAKAVKKAARKEAKRLDPVRIAKRAIDAMTEAIAAVRKAEPSIPSDQIAILRIAENPRYAEVWAAYRAATEGEVGKRHWPWIGPNNETADTARPLGMPVTVTPLKPMPVEDVTNRVVPTAGLRTEAYTKLEGIGAQLRAVDPSLSEAASIALAIEKNPELYRADREERLAFARAAAAGVTGSRLVATA